MQVDDALIDKLAALSMLRFEEEEREKMKEDLEKMIAFIGKLQELDTKGIEPLLHMSGNTDVLRNDEPGNMLNRSEALGNAPQHDDLYFKVPKAIRKPS